MTKEELKDFLNDRDNWKIFEELVNERQLSNMYSANFEYADLSHAFLRRADLSHAHLEDADLKYSWVQKADFGYARLGKREIKQKEVDMTKRTKELVELALKNQLTNKTRTELVKILFTDSDGDIWLSELQLQDFDGDLYMHKQKVKCDLHQDYQTVEGYAIIGNDNFAGIKEWKNGEYKITKPINPYDNMSREELIEELKKVKGGQ